jgi:hypothetical protein
MVGTTILKCAILNDGARVHYRDEPMSVRYQEGRVNGEFSRALIKLGG